jgi:hypothetical protein
MMKWINTIFLGSCFIAAILTESYSIQILNGNLIVTTGLGIVVLLTGYLFMDSIGKLIRKNSDRAKFYVDQILKEEDEKWGGRYTEVINLQKASYTATKKNTAALTEQFEEVFSRLEALENSNRIAWQKVTELQKKSLEGQKNALNFEINHMNENMKRLAGMLQEDGKNHISEQLERLLELLENNNLLPAKSKLPETDYENENTPEPGLLNNNEPESEAANSTNKDIKVTPLYDDPNKALTTEEIAALFASVGK